MTELSAGTSCSQLIERLDRAAAEPDVARICDAVKGVLTDLVADGLALPGELLEPSPDGYARRLLHRCPEGRYSVVVMVWDSGQGTPIHDHAGQWCVECVYDGRIRVESYELLDDASAERVRFKKEIEIVAGVGEAGALIPPYEYHVIANPFAEKAVTIHVYGNEIAGCHKFEPIADNGDGSGLYEKRWSELGYSA